MDLISICVATGTRAEYGLLRPLLDRFRADSRVNLQVVATGAHLAPEFGLTYREIEADGHRITESVEMLLSSETTVGTGKSMGLCIGGFVETFARLKPDLVLVLGDRYEMFCVAAAATVSRVPVCHLYGGDTTEGALDEVFRHCLTKMSHLHFTSTEIYRRRVIQLGEDPARVFNVGAISIDNVLGVDLMGRKGLEASLGIHLQTEVFLVTFHPPTMDGEAEGMAQLNQLLLALDTLQGASIIITGANADTGGAGFNRRLIEYCQARPETHYFVSLGIRRYLSMMKLAQAVVGNSSSGIVESPAMGIPAVNIGDRQKGRLRADSVLDVKPDQASILKGIRKACSVEFRAFAATCPNPYGKGDTAERIHRILLEQVGQLDLKKRFYDLSWAD